MRRLLLAVPILFLAAPAVAQEGGLVVSGSGQVTVAADMATISVAIETQADEAAVAGARNAQLAEQVRAAVLPLADEVTTSGYSVQQNWERSEGERRPDGYIARLVLEVEITDLSRVGTVIDASLGAGANRIDGVRFTSSRMQELRHEALALAVHDALETARTMANAAGGELGSLIELSTEGTVGGPVYRYQEAASSRMLGAIADTDINPGDLNVEAQVVGRWRFVPRER